MRKRHRQHLSKAFCDFTLSLKVLSWHRLFSSFITGLLLFCALIILVAGIIFDFHKSWSVGFARLLCWAGTMAIPQPPALPSITQFLQIMTLPIICVCVRATHWQLGKSHLNHNRRAWWQTEIAPWWCQLKMCHPSFPSLFFYIFIVGSAFMKKHATGFYWQKSLLWLISLTNTLNSITLKG